MDVGPSKIHIVSYQATEILKIVFKRLRRTLQLVNDRQYLWINLLKSMEFKIFGFSISNFLEHATGSRHCTYDEPFANSGDNEAP